MANELADRPYGTSDDDNVTTRTTIVLPKSLLFKLEDIARANKRSNNSLNSVSAIIRNCIKESLSL